MVSISVSNQLRFISLICIFLVLFIHSGFSPEICRKFLLLSYLQILISDFLGNLAVPSFFIISGYLFFHDYSPGNSIKFFKGKFISRFYSLGIPYLLTCLFFVGVIYFVNLLPLSFLSNSDLASVLNHDWKNLLYRIFIRNEPSFSPIAFHLWFLRDLILIVLLSPFVCFLVSHLRLFWLILLLLFISFANKAVASVLISMFWFSLGIFISFNSNIVSYAIKMKYWNLLFILFYLVYFLFLKNATALNYPSFNQFMLVLGIVGFYYILSLIANKEFNIKVVQLSRFSFFIYLFHEPFLNIIRKSFLLVNDSFQFSYIFSYLLSPFICFFILHKVALVLKRSTPLLFSVISGGR